MKIIEIYKCFLCKRQHQSYQREVLIEAGEWVFSNRVDVTDQHPVTISEDGQSFVVNLGDISENDQYRIDYDVRLNYEPVDGELLKNDATLKEAV